MKPPRAVRTDVSQGTWLKFNYIMLLDHHQSRYATISIFGELRLSYY